MLKIIGGNKKRKIIEIPKNKVRPTSSKKRESIFSILESNALKNNIQLYDNKIILDLYAGSGSLGLEAISRGAKFCYFYEKDEYVYKVLENNCKKICENNYEIILKDIEKCFFNELKKTFSIIFIDPPYDINPFEKVLNKLLFRNLISKNTNIIIETNKNTFFKLPKKLKKIDERFFGKTKITFLGLGII
tara:strand:+ start:3678 stop:4247 length:570 start_codon:yes stop_codon:yes gene_type:complete